MKQSFGKWIIIVICGFALAGSAIAQSQQADFGAWVEHQLDAHAMQLFGINGPLPESALGPFTGVNSADAVIAAPSLSVSVVSTAVHTSADMIALWPDDANPTHLFVCDEGSSNPSVQRVNLAGPVNANATTVVTGLVNCDPVRRTPWGSIIVGEETTSGAVYELMDPLSVNSPIGVTNRTLGTTSDPNHLVKRQAVGQLAFEGIVFLDNGTMYFGDELRPGGGNPGGAIYKFVPTAPYGGLGQITIPALSPLAGGSLYGLRVGSTGDNGQGTEIGQGTWVAINSATYNDGNGNIVLRTAQAALKFTGYYRPEDMDADPIARERGEIRNCWANTGRMSHGGGSMTETGSIYGEIMCLTDVPSVGAPTGAIPTVRRFIAGDRHANYFDNLAFQPSTGNLIVLEDGETEVVTPNGTELRGNDIWSCLPDGADRDVQSDGCVRILSLKDTSSEPTGFIFTASGESAYVNLQHRATGQGALLKITGFRR